MLPKIFLYANYISVPLQELQPVSNALWNHGASGWNILDFKDGFKKFSCSPNDTL